MILPVRSEFSAACDTGVCGDDVPPLVGSVLTGTGLTLAQAARALERGERPPLSDVQRRLVERWLGEHAFGSARGRVGRAP
jgi:hypothetical protein